MLIFLDTEFTDLLKPDLISIGAITEDGKHSFYEERFDYDRTLVSDFVRKNVIPYLDNVTVQGKVQVANKFFDWLKSLPQDQSYQIMVDYVGDQVLVMELFEKADDEHWPANVDHDFGLLFARMTSDCIIKGSMLNMPINDLNARVRKEFYSAFLNYFYDTKENQHHALSDAKANRVGWIAAQRVLNYGH